MRNPLAVGAATLAVVLSLGLAACGSSDDSGDSGDSTLSNSELIAQADQVCTDYNKKLTKIQENTDLTADSSKEDIAAFISDDIVPLYKDQIASLRELNPNEDDADDFNDIVDTLDSELKAVEDDPEGSIDESDPFAGATAKAKEFGLKVCGSN
ncbi:MAG: hypothetical protein J0H66_00290 [Solirubrobacterales bacterium]|nr:hypothetical protein [Solirubrobacterales bacterium]